MSPLYPGLDPDDMLRLDALASAAHRHHMTFDYAFSLLEYGSPREAAEQAWDDFVAYYTPSSVGAQSSRPRAR